MASASHASSAATLIRWCRPLGANTFTRNLSAFKPGSTVLNTLVAEVLPVPGASFATISGLTGSDTYVLGGNNWGVATVVEIPGLAPDVAIRDGYDTLDFSASTENLFFRIYKASDILPVLDELHIDGFRVLDDTVIIGVEGQYFSDARDDFTGMFDDLFDGRLQLAYAKSSSLGSIVFANNIENIVGGKGLNSIKLIRGASLTGTVTVPQGGQVVLDYSEYLPEGATGPGIDVDIAAGLFLESPRLNIPDIGFSLLEDAGLNVNRIGGGGIFAHDLSYGSATGFLGNRLRGVSDLYDKLPTEVLNFVDTIGVELAKVFPVSADFAFKNYAVQNVIKVIGTSGKDTLRGSRGDNIFISSGGADEIFGISGVSGDNATQNVLSAIGDFLNDKVRGLALDIDFLKNNSRATKIGKRYQQRCSRNQSW